MFLEISQNSQENNCARARGLNTFFTEHHRVIVCSSSKIFKVSSWDIIFCRNRHSQLFCRKDWLKIVSKVTKKTYNEYLFRWDCDPIEVSNAPPGGSFYLYDFSPFPSVLVVESNHFFVFIKQYASYFVILRRICFEILQIDV